MRIARRQAGDTIVEVLIASAIIAMVLALGYATSNRAVQIIRNAQERTEATKLAEGQIELLKVIERDLTATMPNRVPSPDPANTRCLQISGSTVGLSTAPCERNGYYRVVLEWLGDGAAPGDPLARTYRAAVQWEALGTGATQEVEVYYRSVRSGGP